MGKIISKFDVAPLCPELVRVGDVLATVLDGALLAAGVGDRVVVVHVPPVLPGIHATALEVLLHQVPGMGHTLEVILPVVLHTVIHIVP